MPNILTIGIPTFNRATHAHECVQRVLSVAEDHHVDVLVSDNASSDDTSRLMNDFTHCQGFRFVQRETNGGWVGNISSLLQASRTDYVFLLCDEDALFSASLQPLEKLLREERPELVGTSGLGLSPSTVETGVDFWSLTQGLSGLVLNRKTCLDSLERISSSEIGKNLRDGWEIYPQVILALDIWLRGGTFVNFGRPLVESCIKLPTIWEPHWASETITVPESRKGLPPGQQYFRHVSSRLRQQESFARWVEGLILEDPRLVDARRLKTFQRFQEDYAAGKLLGYIREESPYVSRQLVRGIRRQTRPSGVFVRRVRGKLSQVFQRLRFALLCQGV